MRGKRINTKKKRFMVLILAIMVLFNMSMGGASAFSGKKGSVYTVTDGGRITYGPGDGGYSNSKKCDLGDELGTRYSYCVQPDKPSPTATRVTVDRVVTDDADTGRWNAMRNICYYSPSYPGYENNVKKVKDKYYTGDFAKDWGIAHLALSYVFEKRPEDLETYGNTKASDLGSIWTKAKNLGDALWEDGTKKDDAVPDNFKVFICHMAGVQDMVVGYLEAPGTLKIKKTSTRTSITDENDRYSLSGAEYEVYDSEGDSKGTLEITKQGESAELELPAGDYTVKETKAPKGYALDTRTYSIKIESEELTVFTAKDEPITAKIDLILEKKGKDYPYNSGEGDASLKNAVYKVEYYDAFPGDEGDKIASVTKDRKPEKTWYFLTDDKGLITSDTLRVSAKYESDKLYKDADENVIFPLGSYVIREVKAPAGYLLNDEGLLITVREDGTDKANTTNFKSTSTSEEIIKGGVRIRKIDPDLKENGAQGSGTLKGAVFTIYNESAASVIFGGREVKQGEEVTNITTGKDGFASTGDRDLPYGTYSIRETKAPEGYGINEEWKETFSIREDGEIVDKTGNPVEEPVVKGGVCLSKTDRITEGGMPQGDGKLKGAEFTISNRSSSSVTVSGKTFGPGEDVLTITTDEKGFASTESHDLPFGDYSIRETKAPEGYRLNEEWKEDFTINEAGKILDLTETTGKKVPEDVMRSGIQLMKYDLDLGRSETMGGADLEGIEFTLINRSEHPVIVRKALADPGIKVDWSAITEDDLKDGGTLKEVPPGEILGTISTHWNEDKKAFTAETLMDDLPYGSYGIKETASNKSYCLTDGSEHVISVKLDGSLCAYDDGHEEILTFGNRVWRSDVRGTKIGDGDSRRMALIPFKIISVATGETHVVVTDKNGFFTTERRITDSSEKDPAETARIVNCFDDLLDEENITNEIMEKRYDKIRSGVWFGKGSKGSENTWEAGTGALPYGSYILEEMRAENNEGYTLQKFFFTVEGEGGERVIDLETITDDVPEIGTSASVGGRNEDVVPDSKIVLKDDVEYSGLKKGEKYILEGVLMDKETGEPAKDSSGNEIRAEKEFTAGKTSGRVRVTFEFDGSNMAGRETVVFEKLYDASGRIIASHEDPEDEYQTITWQKNDEPDVPDVPDVPLIPDVPDQPEVPDEPEIPDVPNEPEIPDKPETPDKPEKKIVEEPVKKTQLPQKEKTPRTGDETGLYAWMLTALLSLSGIAGARFFEKDKDNNERLSIRR